jgi:4-hydroxy-tetrahydrodipicolinate reductase
MKIAIIGNGKTGKHLQDIIHASDIVGPFSKTKPITSEITSAKTAIVFIPGPAFETLIPTLLEYNLNLVIGATAMSLPSDLNKTLSNKNLTWVMGANFSIGVQVVRKMLETYQAYKNIFNPISEEISEWHHTAKLDSPSGTALKMQEWLKIEKMNIKSFREGDIVGTHEIKLNNLNEEIKVTHTANSRKLFAQGAYEIAKLVHNKKIRSGLISIEEVFDQLGGHYETK